MSKASPGPASSAACPNSHVFAKRTHENKRRSHQKDTIVRPTGKMNHSLPVYSRICRYWLVPLTLVGSPVPVRPKQRRKLLSVFQCRSFYQSLRPTWQALLENGKTSIRKRTISRGSKYSSRILLPNYWFAYGLPATRSASGVTTLPPRWFSRRTVTCPLICSLSGISNHRYHPRGSVCSKRAFCRSIRTRSCARLISSSMKSTASDERGKQAFEPLIAAGALLTTVFAGNLAPA